MVKRVLVGAHHGLREWLIQRLTAILMIIYTIALLVIAFTLPNTHEGWRALFAGVPMKVFSSVTVLGLFWHVWIGMRDILMDYLWKFSVRLTAMFFVALFLVANLVWAFNILWSVN